MASQPPPLRRRRSSDKKRWSTRAKILNAALVLIFAALTTYLAYRQLVVAQHAELKGANNFTIDEPSPKTDVAARVDLRGTGTPTPNQVLVVAYRRADLDLLSFETEVHVEEPGRWHASICLGTSDHGKTFFVQLITMPKSWADYLVKVGQRLRKDSNTWWTAAQLPPEADPLTSVIIHRNDAIARC